MAVKLIVCDVDGTLIDIDRKWNKDLDTIAKLVKERNIPFTIASGRIFSRIENIVHALNIRVPYIGCNGAFAKFGDDFLWNDFIPANYLKNAVQIADEAGMSVIYTDGIQEKAYRNTAWVQDLVEKYNRYDGIYQPKEDEWEHLKIQKVLIADAQNKECIDLILSALQPYKPYLNIVVYPNGAIDITTKSSSKGEALKRLVKEMNLDFKEIMAIGDHQNDIEMIQLAGIGVAVGNATQELKNYADYVCKENTAKGVMEAINKFYLNQEVSK